MSVPRVYVAGPMTGYPEWNYPAFFAMEERLQGMGYAVENPARTDGGDTSKPWAYYLRKAIRQMLTCDSVVCLPGWRFSRGANLEVYVARQIGMPILDDKLEPVNETILQEAGRLVNGDRNIDYGHPYFDFSRVIGGINAMFAHKLKEPFEVREWPLVMQLVKISREVNAPKRDNAVDGAGYWQTLEMVKEKQEELGEA